MGKVIGRVRTAPVILLVGVSCTLASAAGAQDRFGGQARADAAGRMVILGVQQGISSLPPTSGQSIVYEFDPELSTFVPSEQLGPTSFRSTQTIGKGKWSLRGSMTYFRLHQTFGPIKYTARALNNTPGTFSLPARRYAFRPKQTRHISSTCGALPKKSLPSSTIAGPQTFTSAPNFFTWSRSRSIV